MRPGKLSPSELSSYVFPRRGINRSDVLVHAALGHDAAVIDFGDQVAVLSTDPITGAGRNAGWLAVQIAANDVAVMGARPVGVLLTLLLAPSTAADDARTLMEDADRAARQLGIEILGGHSEVTAGLDRSIVVVTALGRAGRDRYVRSDGARPGDTVLLTGAAGLEGTAVLASDFGEVLDRYVSVEVLRRARSFSGEVSVVGPALAAAEQGVSAMHDATEGGVLGALAELAGAAGVGIEVDGDQIPVRDETRAICGALAIDPLNLVSSGALLIATPVPAAVIDALRGMGAGAVPIGQVVAGPSHLRRNGVVGNLEAPSRDALWDAIERLSEASKQPGH